MDTRSSFFKSSSLIVSFVFMVFMILLLVVNESHRFKKSGLTFKFGLLSLCFLCYFAYVTPIFAGSIGMMVFFLSMFVGTLPLVFAGWWIQIYRPTLFEKAKRQILVPFGIVLLSFLSLYGQIDPPRATFNSVYRRVSHLGAGSRRLQARTRETVVAFLAKRRSRLSRASQRQNLRLLSYFLPHSLFRPSLDALVLEGQQVGLGDARLYPN